MSGFLNVIFKVQFHEKLEWCWSTMPVEANFSWLFNITAILISHNQHNSFYHLLLLSHFKTKYIFFQTIFFYLLYYKYWSWRFHSQTFNDISIKTKLIDSLNVNLTNCGLNNISPCAEEIVDKDTGYKFWKK